jgi:hypothetical protein
LYPNRITLRFTDSLPQACRLNLKTYTLCISSKLAKLLGNHSLLSKDDNNTLQLLLSDCNDGDVTELTEFLQRCADVSIPGSDQSEGNVDFTQYFSAVIESTLYRPANPKLAIFQVAKAYHLDQDKFSQAFKSRTL